MSSSLYRYVLYAQLLQSIGLVLCVVVFIAIGFWLDTSWWCNALVGFGVYHLHGVIYYEDVGDLDVFTRDNGKFKPLKWGYIVPMSGTGILPLEESAAVTAT